MIDGPHRAGADGDVAELKGWGAGYRMGQSETVLLGRAQAEKLLSYRIGEQGLFIMACFFLEFLSKFK
jgi:hypothetical protein